MMIQLFVSLNLVFKSLKNKFVDHYIFGKIYLFFFPDLLFQEMLFDFDKIYIYQGRPNIYVFKHLIDGNKFKFKN